MSDDIWERRFLLYMVVRLIGLALFLLGLAIAYSDLVRPGGFPQLGAVLAIIGAVGGMFAPRLLTKRWRREDS